MDVFGVQNFNMFYGWTPYVGMSSFPVYMSFQNSLMFPERALDYNLQRTNLLFNSYNFGYYPPTQFYNLSLLTSNSESSNKADVVTKTEQNRSETSSVTSAEPGNISSEPQVTDTSAKQQESAVGESFKASKDKSKDLMRTDKRNPKTKRVASIKVGDTWNGHRVTSTFGHRKGPTAGASTNHKGVDLAYYNNEPFKSLSKGKVVKVAKNNKGYGKYVDVRDEKGTVHRYAHANRILVNVGDKVSIGTVLGRAGATGNATGPHLHYERIEHGVKVNPVKTDNFTSMA